MKITPQELAKLPGLMTNARAMGWQLRIGSRGRAVITRPKGGDAILHAVLCSYRDEIAALLRDEAQRDASPKAERPRPRLAWSNRR